MILNIGCGKRRIEGALNIDIDPNSDADINLDMSKIPWIWKDNSIDKIYLYHSLEHFPNLKEVIMECYRVLIPNGLLDVHVPHVSSVIANGCLYHFRGFSFNSLKDLTLKEFEIISQRIIWQPHWEWLPIQWLIDLSPRLFERFWCYLVGGAMEVQCLMKKVPLNSVNV